MNKIKFIMVMTVLATVVLFVKNIQLSPSEIAMYRASIGAIVLLIANRVVKKHSSFSIIKKNLPYLIFSGIAIGLNWIFLFTAYNYTSVANAILTYYLAPVFVLLFSPLVLKEKLTSTKILSILGALIGMGFLVGANFWNINTSDMIGIGAALLAALFYASSIFANKSVSGITDVETALYQFFTMVITIVPYVFFTKGIHVTNIPLRSIPFLLILGIVHTGICYLLYFSLLKKLSSSSIAIYSYVDPIAAVLFSAIFLNEKITLYQIIGGILILGSTFLAEFFDNKKIKQ